MDAYKLPIKACKSLALDLINGTEVEKSFTVLFIALISSCSPKSYVAHVVQTERKLLRPERD